VKQALYVNARWAERTSFSIQKIDEPALKILSSTLHVAIRLIRAKLGRRAVFPGKLERGVPFYTDGNLVEALFGTKT